MKLIRNHQWTNSERLDLLKICSDESVEKDWVKRAEVMAKKYSVTSLSFFFTAKTCHAEIERILSSPCPGIEPNTSGQYSYSHKVMMEKWITHYTQEIEEEKDRKVEIAMVEVRRCTSLIDKLMSDKMSLEEMGTLLDQLRMEDPKREEDIQFKRVVSTYSNRLLHIWKEGGLKKLENSTQLGATKVADPSIETPGFMTPTYVSAQTPSISSVSSPIRSVAEALKDAVPIFVEPIPASPVKLPKIATPVRPNEQEEDEIKKELDIKVEIKEDIPVDAPKQRGRPRLSKPSTPKVAAWDPVSMAEAPVKTKRTADISVDSSSSRRSKLGTPPVVAKLKKKDEPEEKKPSRSVDSFEIPSARSTPMPTSIPTETVPISGQNVECQTNICIKMCIRAATPVSDKRKSSATAAGTRKSLRRSDGKTTPLHTSTSGPSIVSSLPKKFANIGCQTGRIEFDKDDLVVMQWSPFEQNHVEMVTVDKKKKERKLAEDTVLEIKNEMEDELEESTTRRGSKSEARSLKHELQFVIDTEDPIAEQLIHEKGFKSMGSSFDGGSSSTGETPAKRVRKDDRTKEETTNLKFQLINMWRALSDHKHSGIFSHAVTEKDAPGYTTTVKKRVDLSNLRKEIESGVIASKHAFLLKAYRMFANAVMFNSTGHDVNTFAKIMVRDVMNDVMSTSTDDRKPGISRRSKIMDEARSSQRSRSIEPEPMVQLGVPGSSRKLFKRRSTRHTKITNYK